MSWLRNETRNKPKETSLKDPNYPHAQWRSYVFGSQQLTHFIQLKEYQHDITMCLHIIVCHPYYIYVAKVARRSRSRTNVSLL